jgi:hypothetical protein
MLVCTGTSMYWYVEVQHSSFIFWYVPVYTSTGVYKTAIIRTSYIQVCTTSKSWWLITLGASILGRYMEVYTSHVQHNTSLCFKCKIIHFLASSVRRMYIQVYTGIYCHVRIYTKATTTFHLESGSIGVWDSDSAARTRAVDGPAAGCHGQCRTGSHGHGHGAGIP